MIKYVCDICGNELIKEEIYYCNEMIGYGHYCFKHVPKKEAKIYTYPPESSGSFIFTYVDKYFLNNDRVDVFIMS